KAPLQLFAGAHQTRLRGGHRHVHEHRYLGEVVSEDVMEKDRRCARLVHLCEMKSDTGECFSYARLSLDVERGPAALRLAGSIPSAVDDPALPGARSNRVEGDVRGHARSPGRQAVSPRKHPVLECDDDLLVLRL